ncbi:sensor domain-containing protein [Deinococcus sedimenti]|uniref:Diguanylate cyclase n=1 Tax=Deinococcus sedimenti TaxID=1867090 RepID=A0ABQ2S9N6_9DEIO|nr:diguanylate cyclase [Deinococcus sedimenti]GGS01479.1 hypothetical protein GCM10008960_30230 [Deinococcus sedimenti]
MPYPPCAPEPTFDGHLYLTADRSGVITYANGAASRWLRRAGAESSELIGVRLTDTLAPGCTVRARLGAAPVVGQPCGTCSQLTVRTTLDGYEVHGPLSLAAPADREDLAERLNAAPHVDDVVQVILNHPAWQALSVQVALFDGVGSALRVLRAGPTGPVLTQQVPVHAPHPLSAAFHGGSPASSAPAAWAGTGLLVRPDASSLVTLPLKVAGRPLGLIVLEYARPATPDRAWSLAALCSAALDRAAHADEASRGQLRYRTLLESTHAALWELDRDFAIQGESPNWEALTGQRFEEYAGRGYLDVLHPQDRARLEADIARGIQGTAPFELRGRMRRADGQYRHVAALALPVPEQRGHGHGWAGSIQDVTEEIWAAEWEGPAQHLLTLSVQGGPAWPTFRAVLAELVRVGGAAGGVLVEVRDRRSTLRPVARQGQVSAPMGELTRMAGQVGALAAAEQPTWRTNERPDAGARRDVLAVPLRHDGQLIALGLLYLPGGSLNATDLEHLRWLQAHLAPVMHSAQLRDALERSEAQARSIVSALDEGVILMDVQGRLMTANRAARELLDLPRDLPLHLQLTWDLDNERGERLTREQHPAAVALRSAHAVRRVILARTRSGGGRLWLSMNAIPLEDRSGVVVSFSDVTEAVTLRQQLTEQALQDDLTGLGNRRAFQRAVRDLCGARAAALLIDVDHFKAVNDTHGHHVGDDLLRALAARLRALAPAPAVVARLGGDEFGIVHPDLPAGAAARLAQAIVQGVARPVELGSVSAQVSASVGVATLECVPDGDLHRAADLAMYAVKRAGKAGWQAFEAPATTA